MVEAAGWAVEPAGLVPLRRGRGATCSRSRAGPPGPGPGHRARHVTVAHPAQPLGVEIRAGAGSDGAVDLPSGALLVRCDGRPAAALAGDRPVVMVDRTLDDATAAGIAVAACEGCPAAAVDEATGLLQAAGLTVYVIDDAPGLVVTRTVAMLVNGAVDAPHKGVASAADIDAAMRLGANYRSARWPGDKLRASSRPRHLDTMHAWYSEDRTAHQPCWPDRRRRRITDLTGPASESGRGCSS